MCGNQCGRTPDDCHDEKVISNAIKTVKLKDVPLLKIVPLLIWDTLISFYLMKIIPLLICYK